jgi:hypothetical protein
MPARRVRILRDPASRTSRMRNRHAPPALRENRGFHRFDALLSSKSRDKRAGKTQKGPF